MRKPYIIAAVVLALYVAWKWQQNSAFNQAAASMGLGNTTVQDVTPSSDP